jgi:dihydrofolate reductase/thymidylate synthase
MKHLKTFNVILATGKNGELGLDNDLPWDFMSDKAYFKKLTSETTILPGINKESNILITGRKTFESLLTGVDHDIYKPLSNRILFVITSDYENINKSYFLGSYNGGIEQSASITAESGAYNSPCDTKINKSVYFFPNFLTAYLRACTFINSDIWVIGGSYIYEAALKHWACDKIYLTKINDSFTADTFIDLNKYNIEWTNSIVNTDIDKKTHKEYKLKFKQGNIKSNIETAYLQLLHKVITTSDARETRNGITFSKFNTTLSCDVGHSFPLLTTKLMFWKGIVEELLFFIRGYTDTTILSKKQIKIWEPNTNQEFLDKMGFNYPVGEMGPMYGYQWRHFNKQYPETENDTESGIDQLQFVINEIKTNPSSRRILLTTFNPAQVNQGVLYPCHSIIIQFYVEDDKLNCAMYQRSADLFLGVPFNIASTALLLHIIAKITKLKPNMMHLHLGDYHVYKEHINAVWKQLERTPRDLPQLEIPDFETIEDVEKSQFENYKIINYNSYGAIKAAMIP